MPSLTGLSADVLLTDAIQFVVDTLVACDYTVCSTSRWHAEPEKLRCCDCADSGAAYTVIGWIDHTFAADGTLREVSSLDCPTLDATVIGLTVARCWPVPAVDSKLADVRDTAAAELALVMDCLRTALGACESLPSLFGALCSKMLLGRFVARRAQGETPYGETGQLQWQCAGWQFSLTVA